MCKFYLSLASSELMFRAKHAVLSQVLLYLTNSLPVLENIFSLVCQIIFDHLGKLKPSKAFDPGVTLTLSPN